MSENALTTLMEDAVAEAPPRMWSVDHVRSAARARQVRRRRVWGLAGGVAVAASIAGAALVVSGPAARPPAPAASSAASGVAIGFPVASAVEAVMGALPSGAEIGELPPDIAWRDGGALTVPITVDGSPAVLELVAADSGCSATSPALSQPALDAVEGAVCTARAQALAADPAGLPSGGGPAS
jgi:hypothetical protein